MTQLKLSSKKSAAVNGMTCQRHCLTLQGKCQIAANRALNHHRECHGGFFRLSPPSTHLLKHVVQDTFETTAAPLPKIPKEAKQMDNMELADLVSPASSQGLLQGHGGERAGVLLQGDVQVHLRKLAGHNAAQLRLQGHHLHQVAAVQPVRPATRGAFCQQNSVPVRQCSPLTCRYLENMFFENEAIVLLLPVKAQM